jgi:hypothetical protein
VVVVIDFIFSQFNTSHHTIEIIYKILLYNGTELYKSKRKNDNKNYIRFIPDIFTKAIGYLFDNVKSNFIIKDEHVMVEVKRHNSIINIIIIKEDDNVIFTLTFCINKRIRYSIKCDE